MMRTIKSAIRCDRGAALIELAVALPLLVAIFAATVDFARVFNASIALTNAARAGALYGAANVANSSDTAGMQSTALASIVPNTGVAATAGRLCQCASNAGVFSATSPANSCTTAETSACTGGGHRVITVTVTTTRTFTTIMGAIPGIPNSVNLTRSATLRVAN